MASAQTQAYQDRYTAAADRYASAYNIPADIFRSLIKTESGWNPYAIGGAGEIGLGQLKPGTAAQVGVNAWDPEQNLKGAADYLSRAFAKVGNWRDALALYNQGLHGDPAKGAGYADKVLSGFNMANITGGMPLQDQSAAADVLPKGAVDTSAWYADPLAYVGDKLKTYGVSAAWIAAAALLIALGLWATISAKGALPAIKNPA